jgi:hypothetical protein
MKGRKPTPELIWLREIPRDWPQRANFQRRRQEFGIVADAPAPAPAAVAGVG